MKKIISMVLVSGWLMGILSGCNVKNPMISDSEGPLMANFDVSICDQIPTTAIEEVLGIKIVRTEPTTGNITNVCDYYTDDANWITMRLNKLNYDNQKTGQSGMEDVKIETDSSIDAEHFIVLLPVDNMINILIKIEENLVLTVENGLSTAYSRDEMIAVAAVAVKQLRLNYNSENYSEQSDLNNISTGSQKDLAVEFLDDLVRKDIDAALALMDVDDDNKQAWGVNFNTIEELKLNKIVEVYQDEWTDNRQVFKVDLGVKVGPAG